MTKSPSFLDQRRLLRPESLQEVSWDVLFYVQRAEMTAVGCVPHNDSLCFEASPDSLMSIGGV
jgi:hypothetical protein